LTWFQSFPPAPVGDKTWNNLTEIGGWAKNHAPHAVFVTEVIPEPAQNEHGRKLTYSAQTTGERITE